MKAQDLPSRGGSDFEMPTNPVSQRNCEETRNAEASEASNASFSSLHSTKRSVFSLEAQNRVSFAHLKSKLTLHYSSEIQALESLWEKNCMEHRCTAEVVQQRTPFGLNRYLLLVCFLTIAFIKGSTYWGWTGMQEMLYKAGAFSWKCQEPYTTFQKIGDTEYPDCPSRKSAINGLYTAALASHLIFSFPAGIMLDWLGPKATLALGICVDACGWCLLAASSKSFQAYYPATILIGIAADLGYLPLLCVANIFPGYESTVMGITGSVRSLSHAIPVILATAYQTLSTSDASLWKVLLIYVCVGLGTSLVICLFFVPCRAFEGVNDRRLHHQQDTVSEVRRRVLQSARLEGLMTSVNNSCSIDDNDKNHGPLHLTPKELEAIENSFNEVEKREPDVSLWEVLTDVRFLLLIPVFAINLIRSEFFTKSNKEQLVAADGRNVYTLFTTLNVLAFIPAPAMGFCVDWFGTTVVFLILNLAGILMFAFVMSDKYILKVCACVCYWLYTSFVLTSIYCYVKQKFPNKRFGTISGVTCMVGGAFSLTSIGWYKLSAETLTSWTPKNFWMVDWFMMVGGIAVFVSTIMMEAADRRFRGSSDNLSTTATQIGAGLDVELCSFDRDFSHVSALPMKT